MPQMTGHRYFAVAMRGYGVSHLFYVNSIVGAAMQEMDKVGVKRVVTHGEKAAAYMADGYARACHRPGATRRAKMVTDPALNGHVLSPTETPRSLGDGVEHPRQINRLGCNNVEHFGGGRLLLAGPDEGAVAGSHGFAF